MEWQTVGAIVSALGAIISAIYAGLAIRSQRSIVQHSSNYTHMALAESLIKDHPDLLQLHGINPDLIKRHGLNDAEITYLIHSFTAGDLYYRVGGSGTLTQYRKELLKSKKARDAWKYLIKGKFVSEGVFSQAIDNHLRSSYPGEA